MISVDNDDSERDLTAREINALAAVVTMLTKSASIVGDVDHTYVKKQLYVDKQESIPKEAMISCSKLINTLRKISLKENEVASFLNCFQMRLLRNTVIKFAGTRTKFRERRLHPVPEERTIPSVFVTAPTLYLLFSKEYRIFKEDGETFTSYLAIKTEQDKQMTFRNFFDTQLLRQIMKEQNLTPSYSFYYNNKYDIQFLGEKNSSEAPASLPSLKPLPSAVSPSPRTSNDHDKHVLKKQVKDMSDKIKAWKKDYRILAKQVNQEELERMNIGNEFRRMEKRKRRWDADMYEKLKDKRRQCDVTYSRLRELNQLIKTSLSEMYYTNKKLRGQAAPTTPEAIRLPLSEVMKDNIKKDHAIIQGIDPGIVTTASTSSVKPSTLFESINRYQKLEMNDDVIHNARKESEVKFEFTAGMVNHAVLSTSDRLQRERKMKKGEQTKKTRLDRSRTNRKIRTKRFYKRVCSNQRNEMFDIHGVQKKGSGVVTFVGDWSGTGSYIRGHARRSLGPIIERLESVKNDHVCKVDEYKSTITCSSCFEVTTKQLIRTPEGKKKRIKGAVNCTNENCPRRLFGRSTTINRDANGAKNIALIGFSAMVSEDNLTLPPFRRGFNNSNKQ